MEVRLAEVQQLSGAISLSAHPIAHELEGITGSDRANELGTLGELGKAGMP